MTKRRFNPRLHPLLALGLGLGLAVLLLPGNRPRGEMHSDAEILDRLTAEAPDPAHSPLFWLAEAHSDSDLWRAALERCGEGLASIRPGCRMLRSVEEILAPLEPAPVPAQDGSPVLRTPAPDPLDDADSSSEGDA